MPHRFHRRTSSTSSATSAKPPSIFRYTLILLKARPSRTDLDALSVYSESRSAPPSPTSGPSRLEYFVVPAVRARQRIETPPPPYTP